MTPVRIFISSPGDVALERQIARRVISSLQSEFGDDPAIEPYFWEYEPMRLTKDYQGQIPRTSTFDIVVCILWSRLGSPLGPQYRRPDGTPYRSGTEFEFEDAVDSHRKSGVPDLLVYRNKTDPPIKARPKSERVRQLAQFDELEAVLERWTSGGEIVKGAMTGYADCAQFEELLAEHLRKLIRARRPQQDTAGAPRSRVTWSGSPFRGLLPFEFEHAPVFHGRTRAIQEVVGLVRGQNLARQAWAAGPPETSAPPQFVLVTAMSGIGKSSLIRAGVLPLMTTPAVIEGIGLWRRALMKPASAASLFEALIDALTAPDALHELLADATPKSRLVASLRAHPEAIDLLVKGGLSQARAELLARDQVQLRTWEIEFADAGRTADAERCRVQRDMLDRREALLVLFIDQLEEIFTSAIQSDQNERDSFLQAVNALARSGRAIVFATLRSDFFARASAQPIIASLIKEGALYQLEPPSPTELAEIIRAPAHEAGLLFEEIPEIGRLDDALLRATQHDPAALPLLEFTLDRLYEARAPSGLLTHESYERMNRVEGAIAQSAEAEFARLSPQAQQAFGRLFNALVDLGEVQSEERPVRRQALVSELSARPGIAEFIDNFAAARLLVLDRDAVDGGTVGVVHEALFSHWSRLKDWIEDNRDLLLARRRVEAAARRWEEEDRPVDLLLPDGRLLAEAVELLRNRDALTLAAPVEAFVRRSQAAQKSRLYRRMAAIVGLSVGLTGAGIVSWYEWRSTQATKAEAQLFEFKQAVRKAETDFLAHGPSEQGIRNALNSSQKVLHLIEEIRQRQGHAPDGWQEAAASAHEFSSILDVELGDTEGSLRELEARKLVTTKGAAGLQEVLFRNPEMMSYGLVVFDLKLELLIANEHLKALLASKNGPALKAALDARMKELSSNSAAPAAQQSPPAATAASSSAGAPRQPTADAATPPPKTPSPEESLADSIKIHTNMLLILDWMTKNFGREQDFEWLAIMQARLADLYASQQNWDAAAHLYADRVDTGRRQLESARNSKQAPTGKRPVLESNALKATVSYHIDLASFYEQKLQNCNRAVDAARQGLQFMGSERQLADEEQKRFDLEQIVADCLVRVGRKEEALVGAKAATARMLAASTRKLDSAIWQTIATRDSIARYWDESRLKTGPLATAEQIIDAASDATIGDALKEQGRLDEALARYGKGLAITKKLASDDPTIAPWQHDLALGWERIGSVLKVQGKRDEALAAYRQSLAIRKALTASDAGNLGWQRELSICDNDIGDMLNEDGKRDEALASFRDAFAVLKALVAADADNADWQRGLSISDDRIGDVLKAQGKLDEALAAYREALDIRKALAAQDPSKTDRQLEASISDNNVGDVLLDRKKPDEALAFYRDAFTILKPLVAAEPSNTRFLRDLSITDNDIGDALRAQGKLDDALTAYRDALAISTKLAAEDPDSSKLQRDLLVSHNAIGDVLKAQGNLDGAFGAYRDIVTTASALVAREPDNSEWQRDLDIGIGRIGGLAYAMVLARDFAKALEAADRAISLAPGKTWLYTNRAHALMFLGRTDEARALYLKYRGAADVQDGKSWETVVLEDFTELRKAGLGNPLMTGVESTFAAPR